MVLGLKLCIELVPTTSFYKNLRTTISSQEWDIIRKGCYAEYNHICGICGSEGRLECHEIWEYNNDTHVQKLIGFIALCGMCHKVKHIGLSEILALKGKLNMSDIISHFMTVNICSRYEFEQHKEESFKLWRERSKYNWKLDLSKYIRS